MRRGVKNSTLWRDVGRLSQRVYITKCQATWRLCYVTHNGVLWWSSNLRHVPCVCFIP